MGGDESTSCGAEAKNTTKFVLLDHDVIGCFYMKYRSYQKKGREEWVDTWLRVVFFAFTFLLFFLVSVGLVLTSPSERCSAASDLRTECFNAAAPTNASVFTRFNLQLPDPKFKNASAIRWLPKNDTTADTIKDCNESPFYKTTPLFKVFARLNPDFADNFVLDVCYCLNSMGDMTTGDLLVPVPPTHACPYQVACIVPDRFPTCEALGEDDDTVTWGQIFIIVILCTLPKFIMEKVLTLLVAPGRFERKCIPHRLVAGFFIYFGLVGAGIAGILLGVKIASKNGFHARLWSTFLGSYFTEQLFTGPLKCAAQYWIWNRRCCQRAASKVTTSWLIKGGNADASKKPGDSPENGAPMSDMSSGAPVEPRRPSQGNVLGAPPTAMPVDARRPSQGNAAAAAGQPGGLTINTQATAPTAAPLTPLSAAVPGGNPTMANPIYYIADPNAQPAPPPGHQRTASFNGVPMGSPVPGAVPMQRANSYSGHTGSGTAYVTAPGHGSGTAYVPVAAPAPVYYVVAPQPQPAVVYAPAAAYDAPPPYQAQASPAPAAPVSAGGNQFPGAMARSNSVSGMRQ